jgi:hypothetical protein
MKTTDLFKTSAKKLNESLAKTFGEKLNLESFDTAKLEDARNKLRTQIHTARTEGGFNENIENETLSKAQFMHDAIVAEIMDRAEHIVDTTVPEGFGTLEDEVAQILKKFDENMNEIGGYGDPDQDKIVALLKQGDVEGATEVVWYSYADQDGGELRDMDVYIQDIEDQFADLAQGGDTESIETEGGRDAYQRDYDSSVSGMGRRERENDEGNTEPPNNFAISINGKQWKVFPGRGTYADDRREQAQYQQLRDMCAKKSAATGKKWTVSPTGENPTESIEQNESIEQTGDDMRNLNEGEIQQASAIVTAKTMVDRVGRWIEELSGMENDTLLTLGDSIRDEMGQEMAKQFISACAPAIQAALENLKSTREALSTSVRALTGEEQPAEMLGAEAPEMGADDMGGEAEPDMMNPEMGAEEPAGDDFSAADAAAGGDEEMGRMKRESIDRSSRLLKVLAG